MDARRTRARVRVALVGAMLAAACVTSTGADANGSMENASPEPAAASRHGRRIVFTASSREGSSTNIYSIRLNHGERRRLTRSPWSDRSPSQSPTGDFVAFSRYRSFSPPRASLFMIDAAGRRLVRLTRSKRADFGAVWDAHGRRIAFVRGPFRTPGADEDFSSIFVLNIESGDMTRVTSHESANDNPAWSPDGQKLAFSSNRDDLFPSDPEGGRWDVWISDANGSNATNLTGAGSGDNPAWSPDGSAIIYERFEEQGSNLWITDPEGLSHRRLTTGCDYKQDPVWSADSVWVAYTVVPSGCEPGDEDVVDTHVALVRVADGATLDPDEDLLGSFAPSWSPDSNAVAFVGDRGSFELFRFDVAHERLDRLTRNSLGEADLSWRE